MMTVENIELNPSIVDKFYLQDIRVGYWICQVKAPITPRLRKLAWDGSNNFQFDISSKSNGLGLHPLFISFMPRF